MLLTITNTRPVATDLGFLLHKNPNRCHLVDLAFGKAHVFYPEVAADRCTAALLLEVDPVGLVRNRRGPSGEGFVLEQYVNDRPYAASSFLSVAIAQVFREALQGRSKERQDLAEMRLPLVARLPVLPCRGGEPFLRRLFEPLGYSVEATRLVLDEQFPEWRESRYFRVELAAEIRLSDLLRHLYVLIPVLDDDKHYFVSQDEVKKLLKAGEGWLAAHPEHESIATRYLRHQRSLTRIALTLLRQGLEDPDEVDAAQDEEEGRIEGGPSLNEQRLGAVAEVLRQGGARRILDLGCGEGKLLRELQRDRGIESLVGLDVSVGALEKARDRLRLDRLPEEQRKRVQLLHGSLIYRDERLSDFDAAALVEVIEHFDPPRLAALERVVFEFAAPGTVVITTPNFEYNASFEGLPAGRFRHRDHRFEWTRAEFSSWAESISSRFGYEARILPVGAERPGIGAPTQMGVFKRLK